MDIKKIIEKAIELNIYKTIGQMEGMALIENIAFNDKQSRNDMNDLEEELKNLEKTYGIKSDTTLTDALKILNRL